MNKLDYSAILRSIAERTTILTEQERGHLVDAAERIAELEKDAAIYKKGLLAVDSLICESRGVIGLHLNGDIALWETLRKGGFFEDWLLDFDAAIAAAKEKP